MACDTKGVYQNIICKKSLQHLQLHLSNLLVFFTIIVIPTTHAADCAAKYPCICNQNKVLCRNLGNVSQVPQFHPSNTTYDWLEIRNTPALTTVQKNAFIGLKVKNILLNNLGVTRVELGAFSGLGDTLEWLRIMKTQLETLPDGVFNDVSQSLRHLDLTQNNLTRVSPELFNHLTHLVKLELQYNQLETIQDNAFSQLAQLQTLYLHNNRLKTLRPVIFSQLTQLLYLHVDNNQLKTVSPLLFNNLKHLTSLNLANNQLETIPDDTFSQLKQLKSLFLYKNKLRAVSPTLFSQLTQLTLLALCSNQLETIPDSTFIPLTQLMNLEIDNNPLKTVSPTLFSSLTKLMDLRLNNIKLKTVSPALFNNLTNLEWLHLHNNELETIPDDTFRQLTKLQDLRLDNNTLKTLSSDLFSNLTHLHFITIGHNPFVCDCRLAWLRTSKLRSSPFHEDNPVCFSPPEMKGKSVLLYNVLPCNATTSTVKTTLNTNYSTVSPTLIIPIENNTTLSQVGTESAQTTTTSTNVNKRPASSEKDNSERIALIAVGILSGLLAIALVVTIVIIIKRRQCGKCWVESTKEDHYTHSNPDHTDMDLHTYDSLTVPGSGPSYVNVSATIATNSEIIRFQSAEL